jgi:hypothetical protein
MHDACEFPRHCEHKFELEVDLASFQAIISYRKHYEVVRDQCFRVGDFIDLYESDSTRTGNNCLVQISYITECSDFPGFPLGWVILGLKVQDWALPNADAVTD